MIGVRSPSELTPYLPRVVIRELENARPDGVAELQGTLVFADVAGFTRLSERLARMGPEGAERISDAIGDSFAALLAVAYANGGGLLKFGGDALLLLFEGERHAERACRAAVGHARRAARAGAARARRAGRRCGCRSASTPARSTCSSPAASHREPVFAGTRRRARAADGARGPRRRDRRQRGGRRAAAGPARSARPPARAASCAPRRPAPTRRPTSRRSTTPRAARPRPAGRPCARTCSAAAGAPEHRLVTVAFVRFGGTDARIAGAGAAAAARGLDALLTRVQDAAEEHEVALLGSDVDVDGGKLILCAGAPRAPATTRSGCCGRCARSPTREPRAARPDRRPPRARVHGRHRARLPPHLHGDGRRREPRRAAHGRRRRRARSTPPRTCSTARPRASRSPALGRSSSRARPGPVEAWAVGRARPRAAPHAGRQPTRRSSAAAAELDALRDALAAARGGAGRYVELAGRAGRRQDAAASTRVRHEAVGLTGAAGDLRGARRREPVRAVARAAARARRRAAGTSRRTRCSQRLRAAVDERAPDLAPWLPLLAAAVRDRDARHAGRRAARAALPRRPPARDGRPLPRRRRCARPRAA